MAEGVSVKVTGEAELLRQLKELGAVANKNDVKSALRAAAKPIVKDARTRVKSKRVRKGIKAYVDSDREGQVTAKVGLKGGRQPYFMGLFIELGTGPRIQKSTGRRTGSMPARPFLRPAFEAKIDEAVKAFGEKMLRRINKAAK